jgi:formyltetrahydrofolate-dependent phosphoribosylglycinamide formyltransferase
MAKRCLKLVVLISGTGRTMVNIQEHIAAGELDAQIRLVISSSPDVEGLRRAQDLRLLTNVVSKSKLGEEGFQRRLTAAIDGAGADLVCMGGFLHLWHIPKRYEGRVINIHPALLPDFGGRGLYGHHVHEAVLRAGRKVSGCTIHFCDNQYDHGPVILQREVPVMPDDTPDTLAARVFEQECIAYPEVIRLFAEERVRLDGRRVVITP